MFCHLWYDSISRALVVLGIRLGNPPCSDVQLRGLRPPCPFALVCSEQCHASFCGRYISSRIILCTPCIMQCNCSSGLFSAARSVRCSASWNLSHQTLRRLDHPQSSLERAACCCHVHTLESLLATNDSYRSRVIMLRFSMGKRFLSLGTHE